ncbi:MAG: hypothetical protein AB1716_08635 [Planctomycetota bacterium]
MQKRMLIGLLASVGLLLASGCATLTMTPEESANMTKSVVRTDMRALADDWNMIWLMDHQTRLTRWHTR